MRIGVVANLERSRGGAYQYTVSLTATLARICTPSDTLVVFLGAQDEVPDELARLNLECVRLRAIEGLTGGIWYKLRTYLPDGLVELAKRALRGRQVSPAPIGDHAGSAALTDPRWHAFFTRHDIDMLVFPNDDALAYESGLPFVVAIHDIQHRLHPEFPEVSADGEWECREFRIGNCVRLAMGVLVDSEVGKEDILDAYGIDPAVVHVVPFVPPSYMSQPTSPEPSGRSARAEGLPRDFLFYPAAFWPHKNHRRIIEALALLRADGIDMPIVFVGSTSTSDLVRATFDDVMSTAHTLNVSDLVTYLGYVEDDVMSGLYEDARALVMPTFFGPTNIPVLEAFKMGCPVITSDIRGIREQVGDAGVLVDPCSPQSIADGIRRVLTDPDLVERITAAGHEHLASYSDAEFDERIAHVVADVRSRLGQ